MDPITRMVAAGAAGAAGGGDPTYVDDMFSTHVYEGTSSTQSIDNGIDLSGEGGLVWFKNRITNTGVVNLGHVLQDTERGNTKFLRTQGNAQEETSSSMISSFNSNGFTFGSDTNINFNSDKGVAWTFRKAPGFFDVVTYSGQSNNGVFDTWFTVPHNLGSTPGCVIIKSTSNSESWVVWHRSMPTETMHLNQTGGANDSNYTTWFGHANGAADANNIYIRAGQFAAGYPGYNYVAYVFAHDDQSFGTNSDESIIKCGSYTTNSNGSIPDVNLGFEPQWLLIKNTSTSANWYLYDSMRGMPVGGNEETLYPNLSNAAVTGANAVELTSTGFTGGPDYLASGAETFIYMAIRRPNKPPETGTDVFAIDTSDATSPSPPQFTSGFVTDVVIRKTMNIANNTMGSRLQGIFYMQPSSNTQEDRTWPATALTWDFMDGWSNSSGVDTNLFAYMFKRAPGFMDVVAYKGTGSARTLNHNLGAVPELVIIKNRENGSYGWSVYASHLSSPRDKAMYLNDTMAAQTNNAGTFWGNTDFTSTQISLGSYANTNHNGIDMIAYLFASLDGISKIGTYSGTGSDINVDCGFTAGARFVIIKRTDTEISGSTGTHWYVWDTTNGIVSGNDPYWKVSDAVASVTNTDYIDPLNAGFTVTSSAPAALNTSGGTYLFFAIA